MPLDQAVRDLRATAHRSAARGPIRLLTHLRFFGYSFNPVSFYYVFDATDSRVETIVAEITNTPWKERHAYVLPVAGAAARTGARMALQLRQAVSCFAVHAHGHALRLVFRRAVGKGLHVHMENWREGEVCFDATLNLRRQPMNARVAGDGAAADFR